MNISLTALLVASWVFILLGLFLFERLEHRVAALTAQLQILLKSQKALLAHFQIEPAEQPLTAELLAFLREGRTYEAIATYRAYSQSSYKEAKAYIDALRAKD